MSRPSPAKQYRQIRQRMHESVDGFDLVGEDRRRRIMVTATAGRELRGILAEALHASLLSPEDVINVANTGNHVITDRAATLAFDALVNLRKTAEVVAGPECPVVSSMERRIASLGRIVLRNGPDMLFAEGLSEPAIEHAQLLYAELMFKQNETVPELADESLYR